MAKCVQKQLGNFGQSRCNKMPGRIISLIKTPDNFRVPAATVEQGTAAILTYLNTAATASMATRVHKFPEFAGMEPQMKAPTMEDTVYSYLDVDPGAYRWRFQLRENICIHKALYSHKAYSGRVIFIDHEGQLFGTQLSNGDFAGHRINMFFPEMMTLNDGSVATKSPFVVSLRSNLDIDKNGSLIDFEGLDSEIYRLIDTGIEVQNALGTKVTVRVYAECDDTGIEGLVSADFILRNGAGAAQTISSINELGDGVYELNGTGLVDGTISLTTPALLSVKPYEFIGDPVAVNVP